jgi:hypothetical protein
MSDQGPARDDGGAGGKPEVLRDSTFTVEEGLAYRAFRTGAIWMNKLFFSSLVLLGVWLLYAGLGGEAGCDQSVRLAPDENGTIVDSGTRPQCSVFLTPTALYLGAMAILSFVASLAFGVGGLVVGKRIVEMAKAGDEVGARREGGEGDVREGAPGDVRQRGP